MIDLQISYPTSTTSQEQIRILALTLATYSVTERTQPNNGSTYFGCKSGVEIVERAKTFESYIRST